MCRLLCIVHCPLSIVPCVFPRHIDCCHCCARGADVGAGFAIPPPQFLVCQIPLWSCTGHCTPSSMSTWCAARCWTTRTCFQMCVVCCCCGVCVCAPPWCGGWCTGCGVVVCGCLFMLRLCGTLRVPYACCVGGCGCCCVRLFACLCVYVFCMCACLCVCRVLPHRSWMYG